MTELAKHDLLHEFPEFKQKIHYLKLSNTHFARLFAEYHRVDHECHRIESGAEVASDEHLDARKLERLRLKDQLFAMIKAD